MSIKTLNELKHYYEGQRRKDCISIYDGDFNQIVLIRHGEPAIKRLSYYTRRQVLDFYREYDRVGIKDNFKHPICTDNLPIDKIYHSSIARAVHTAKLLFGDEFKLIGDRRYREFEKSVFKFVNLPMPLKFWSIISRFLWFLGISDSKVEHISAAKKRTRDNANYLSGLSKIEGLVILVAHGFHNGYVARYLKKEGWSLVYNDGEGYLNVKILSKVKNKIAE